MKKNYTFIIGFILLFAYIGFTSNHEVTNIYSDIVPGIVSPSKDYSFTFILLGVLLIGAYIFRKPLSKITGKLKETSSPKDKYSNNVDSSPIESSDTEHENSIDSNETPSGENDYEDKLKDTYKVD